MAASDAYEAHWKRWGPYLSDRQWGTVREDYSAHGTAWEHFPFEIAHQRAYRWGEDGLAGWSDNHQRLCMGLALWNGQDALLKERLFGLTNSQGNHGEDVKELYYHLDATPSHSYLKMLYKYPQAAFPYEELREVNGQRGIHDPEYELLDTGIFAEDRYFDVTVEYARGGVDDLLVQVTAVNRGPEEAALHLLPQLWFRNTWSWGDRSARPVMTRTNDDRIDLEHETLGTLHLYVADEARVLFCENDTNVAALYGMEADGPFKDAFHDYVVRGDHNAVATEEGTKVGLYTRHAVPAGGQVVRRYRLRAETTRDAFADFDATLRGCVEEADAFYEHLQREITDPDRRMIQRQALAGMVWTKQYYFYDIHTWLVGDPGQPQPPQERLDGRNSDWDHLYNDDVISMPDKWEYPWYAAWDLAFHCVPLALIDATFAKQQLTLLTREWYMHPNGQLPAYEWAFDDVNPPVHAWASWRVFQIDRKQRGDQGDLEFLEAVFHKLMLNFTWWVNRKDANDNNIFQGGFLGLDNIGVFDRSKDLPTGGHIDQSDGTSWMAMYSLNLMRMALELALHDRVYEEIANKFFEHFLHIARAMTRYNTTCGFGLWDPDDAFYYDVLTLPDGHQIPLKLRSIVGLIPLFAVETLEPELLERLPNFAKRMQWVLDHRPDLSRLVSRWHEPGRGERRLLSLLRGHRMKCLLKRMLDPEEFLAPHGVRALSRHHLEHPYVFESNGERYEVRYEPGESRTHLFGGNSNWRGPIWFPINYLLIESLQKFHHYYGDEFRVEYPVGAGEEATLLEVADALSERLIGLFERGEDGVRPAMRDHPKMARDPHFRDNLLFYEYFHGEDGRGLGASHQTGWTSLVAKLIHPRQPIKT
ncbi:MAG: glucosidase [Myxococcales bacterium]|nr:glucosidase [Myxococcales bacterium]